MSKKPKDPTLQEVKQDSFSDIWMLNLTRYNHSLQKNWLIQERYFTNHTWNTSLN